MSTEPAIAESPGTPMPKWLGRASLALLLTFITLLPMVYDPGAKDPFRQPKELALRAVAILFIALGALALVHAPRSAAAALRAIRSDLAIAGAIVAWTVITAITSTNRLLSAGAIVTVTASAIFYLAARLIARTNSSPILFEVLFVPAVFSSILASLQEYRIWQPLRLMDRDTHMSTTAFVGNPNDLGSYLVAPIFIGLMGVLHFHGRRRAAYVAVTFLLASGLMASGTRGAFLGVFAGIAVMAIALGRRHIVATGATFAVLIILAVVPGSPLRRGLEQTLTGWEMGEMDVLLSNRLPAFLAAWEMTRDHPVTGVGPGTFGFNFMDYHARLHEKYPAQWLEGWQLNFGFVHNDHLQVAAETGWPGYTLFLAAAGMIAAVSFRRKERLDDPVRTISYLLAIPLLIALLVTCVTQFPLQIAAARCTFLYVFALCRSAGDRDA